MSPTALLDRIDTLLGRVRRFAAARGVLLSLATLVAAAVGATLLDLFLRLPAAPRVAINLGILVLGAIVVRRFLVRPILKPVSRDDLVARIESRFPAFEDRLRSAVEFARTDAGGSQRMQHRTVADAARLAAQFPIDSVIDRTPLLRSLGWFSLAVVLAAVVALSLGGESRRVALGRLVNPFGDDWPKRYQIELTQHPPAKVVAGANIELAMKLLRGDRPGATATLVSRQPGRPADRVMFTRDEATGEFSGSLVARLAPGINSQTVELWIESGDDRTEPITVEVVSRLDVARVNAVITPPAYVRNASASVQDLGESKPRVFVGSNVDLSVAFNKPVDGASVKVRLADDSPWIELKPDGHAFAGSFKIETPARIEIAAVDADGFPLESTRRYEIVAVEDLPPTVAIEKPLSGERRTVQADVNLLAALADDAGIDSATLVIERKGESERRIEIPLVRAGELIAPPPASLNVGDSLDAIVRQQLGFSFRTDALADLDAKPGDRLELYLVVQDNFELDGRRHEPVESKRVVLQLISQKELIDAAVAKLRSVRERVEQAKAQHDRTSLETADLANETENKPELDAGDKAILERLRQEQMSAAAQVRLAAEAAQKIASELETNRGEDESVKALASEVAQRLERTAGTTMQQSRQALGRAANQSDRQADRNKSLDEAMQKQEQAGRELEDAVDRLGDVGSLREAIESAQSLLRQQRELSKKTQAAMAKNLGKRPEQLSPEDRDELEQLARQQEDLAAQTDVALDRMQEAAKEMAEQDPASAEAMQQAAQTALAQRVSESQRSASSQMKQNRQSPAQRQQQQAELGLQVLVGKLEEAEKRKLEQLRQQLAELSEQLSILVRRQSSHNVDAIDLQGGDFAANAKETRDELVKLAERNAQTPTADLNRLAAGQIQTERNTRDLSKTVSQIPDGDAPAAKLSRAASQMERALVSLRAQKLAEAYDPAMITALNALREAQSIVEQQQRDVEQQIAEQQQRAIREAFVELRSKQIELNDETAAIESARDGGGKLDRVNLVRLGRLSPRQAELAATSEELAQRLSSIGSVAFVWMTNKVTESMREVGSQLANGQTGETVARRQKNTTDDLQRIIDGLAVKPREQRFENQQNAGGNGQGQGQSGPRLPAEAELRLLKTIQEAINADTIEVNESKAAGTADQIISETLVELGARQGEVRDVLDQLLQQASRGRMKLPAESPDDVAPANDDDLLDDLLGGEAGADVEARNVSRIGNRLTDARRRLAIARDPGDRTQEVQRQIVDDFDKLIELAQSQQSTSSSSSASSSSRQQQQQQARPSQANAQNAGQANPQTNAAQASALTGGNANPESTLASGQNLDETAEEWGRISPRLRSPVLESKDDQIVERYRKWIEDYTRAVSTQAGNE